MVDPYDWLDIAKPHRPPTHYQLLGLSPNVQDDDAIQTAADRQLRRMQPHLTGPDGALARILRAELIQARDTLLDPDRRSMYDTLSPDVDAGDSAPPAVDESPPDLPAAPDEVPPSGAQPWWKETAVVEESPAAAEPWWKEAPVDEPEPPPPPPIPATPPPIEPPRHRTHAPAFVEPEGQLARSIAKKRGSPIPVMIVVGIAVVTLIAGGAYYGFGRKSKTEIKDDQKDLVKGTQPRPKPPVDPTPNEDDLLPETPIPKDFANQLRAKVYRGHAGGVNGIAVARSGQRFVSVGMDFTVRVWSTGQDEPTPRFKFTSPAVSVAFYGEDRGIAAADGLSIALLDAGRMKAGKPLESPRGGVTSLAISADGRKALTGLTDGYLRLWDTTAGKFDEWPAAPRGPIAVALTPDGSKALAAVADGPVSLWDLRNRNRVLEWSPHAGGAIAVAFSPDGTRAATSGPDGFATVYDLAQKKEVCRMTGHSGPVVGVAWMADGRQIVTAGLDGTARLWDAQTGNPRRWVQTLSAKASCVAVDPSDRFVLVGTGDGPIHLYPLPRVRSEAVAGAMAKPPTDPSPIPDKEAIEVALTKVRSEMAKEYAYDRPDDLALLADNLRRRAGVDGVTPALRYGLLRESRALAIRAGDPLTALGAVEDMALWFDLDEMAEKAATLASVPADADPYVFIPSALLAAERAESDARPEIVERILKRLPATPPPGLAEEQGTRLAAIRQRSTALISERETLRKAMDVLKNAQDDQKSNQTLGTFLCLTRQDWTGGLTHLARGTDPKLIEAAKADMAAPSDPKVQHRVAEMWFALANAATDHRHKRAMLGRARTWFERESKAKQDVADEIKAKARLGDIERLDVPAKDASSLPLLTPFVVRRAYNTIGAEVVKAEWHMDGGAAPKGDEIVLPAGNPALHSRFGLAAGGRLTLALRPDGREIRITIAGQEFAFAGAGKAVRIVVERDEKTINVTAHPDTGDSVARSADLPVAVRSNAVPVTVRVTGTPVGADPAMLTAAIVRGPVSLPFPFAE